MSVEIEIRRTNGGLQRRELVPGKYVIGRATGDIVLNDPGVSTRHAELAVTRAGITLTDLGSTNGTFDGGRRLTAPTLMVHGRPLRLSASTLTLVPPLTQTPAPPAVSHGPAPRRASPLRTMLALAAVFGAAGGWLDRLARRELRGSCRVD
jgi:hypothetical protein